MQHFIDLFYFIRELVFSVNKLGRQNFESDKLVYLSVCKKGWICILADEFQLLQLKFLCM